jgi:hypothetical protein
MKMNENTLNEDMEGTLLRKSIKVNVNVKTNTYETEYY